MEKRILLDENDFELLISGKIVDKEGVQIALQDIGYNVMLSLIDEKQEKLLESYK